MKRVRDVRVLVGGAVLGGSLLALGGALSGALLGSPGREAPGPVARRAVADDPPAAALADSPAPAAAPTVALASVAPEAMSAAAGKAPFDPRRRAPRERYRLPDEFLVEEPPPPPPPPPPAPEFRVLGMAGGAGGGVAVIEVPGEPPRVVSVGEDVMGYHLTSIGDRSVVVSRDGRNVSVAMADVNPAVVSAGPANARGQQPQRGGRGGAPGRGQAGAPNLGRGQVQQRVQETLQRVLEDRQRAQQGGAPGRGTNQGPRDGQQNQRPAPRPPGGGN